ncbi:MAG TPA: glycosyltransferase family 39 protein [Pyrinomonadaceae bacterium]|nr:glycosyltransferase family 39 protein [Pyrinomonadaceae bacterium]
MSQTVELISVEREAGASPAVQRDGLRATLEWAIALALLALILLGLGLRLSGIDRIGFAEDEINKLEAVRAYERGDIYPNAEHPMLMKTLIFISMRAAHTWNASGAQSKISDEAALRFPNVLFGALTALPLFLLTAAFFDRRTGLLAAALWAAGINAITYNRIAKEDTLMVFFMLFAFFFYLYAKQVSGYLVRRKRWSYGLSGASFGLMLASKYFLHYFGLNALYHYLYRVREPEAGEPHQRIPALFYILMFGVFFLANPAVLLPQTWQYLNAYASGQLLTHTGYLMGDQLYKNNMSDTPFWGTPAYFYLLFLAIKVPLPVLAAFLVGLFESFRRWRQPGHAFLLLMFLLWIVPFSLIGAKWLRYLLSLMPFVYMIAAVGIMALIGWCGAFIKRVGSQQVTQIAHAAVLLIFIGLPAWAAYAHRPHYAMYTNALGAGRAGHYFPHDEFYDDGLREAIQFVCASAPQGSAIVHETPGVVRYYLERCGRTDLSSHVLSDPKVDLASLPRPAYIIVQRGRTYFENQKKIEEVRAKLEKVHEVRVLDASAAEVYAAL